MQMEKIEDLIILASNNFRKILNNVNKGILALISRIGSTFLVLLEYRRETRRAANGYSLPPAVTNILTVLPYRRGG